MKLSVSKEPRYLMPKVCPAQNVKYNLGVRIHEVEGENPISQHGSMEQTVQFIDQAEVKTR